MSAAPHQLHPPVEKPEILRPLPPAPVKRPPQRPLKWLVLLAIVVLGTWAFFARRAANETTSQTAAIAAIRTAKVSTGPLERWTRVAGQTAAIDFANIVTPSLRGPESGRELILIDLAKSGAFVKKGTKISQIDAQALQDHVDDLGDTIEAAQSDVQKRKAEQSIEWENLQQSLRVAKSEADKARLEYSAAEIRTDIERQILKLNLDEAEARYKQLQGDLKEKQISHAADIKLLELTLERHTRHRDRHRRDIQIFTMHAPMDGLVVMQQIWRGGQMAQVEVGDQVRPGQPFMKIVNTNKMQVEATMNQTESSDIKVGQRARIRLDAFPGLEFNGHVDGIAALAAGGWRQNYYLRSIPLRIRIEGSDPRLIPDLSASVDIITGKVDDAILAPLSGITHEGGKTVVYVKNAGKFEQREVEVGLRNSTHAVVLAGLQPGEEIRLN